MRRTMVLLVVLAACSGQATPSEQSTQSTAGLSSSSSTTDAGNESTMDTATPSTGGEGDAPTNTDSGRPRAPDFTLALGDGGTYTLSSGDKPVYMVFWAEW